MNVLMCAPDFFDIEYEINPWMHEDNPVVPSKAREQWDGLRRIYSQLGWNVQLLEPVQGLPDLVFTANSGLVYDNKVVLPHFRHPDRQGETEKFRKWFENAGYTNLYSPKYDFEGEGDALIWNDVIFAGYPLRTDKRAHIELADFLDATDVSLQLIDPRFYHLDTAFTIVDKDTVALYPKAFSEESIASVHNLVPNVIEATDQDALAYGLNAVSDGKHIVVPEGATHVMDRFRELGLEVFPCPISEFQKSGGGVKCLTLELRS